MGETLAAIFLGHRRILSDSALTVNKKSDGGGAWSKPF
jgi:hypothetical protein